MIQSVSQSMCLSVSQSMSLGLCVSGYGIITLMMTVWNDSVYVSQSMCLSPCVSVYVSQSMCPSLCFSLCVSVYGMIQSVHQSMCLSVSVYVLVYVPVYGMIQAGGEIYMMAGMTKSIFGLMQLPIRWATGWRQHKFCLIKGAQVLLLGQDFLAATNIVPIYAAGYWIELDKPDIHHPFAKFCPPY